MTVVDCSGHRGGQHWIGNDSGRQRQKAFFIRLECQDGTRKDARQDDRGSGRPHLHILLYFNDFEDLPVDGESGATPSVNDEDLAGYVEVSQCDKSGNSCRDVHRSETCWSSSDQEWTSHHRREDHGRGVRAYFVDFMKNWRCYQDV